MFKIKLLKVPKKLDVTTKKKNGKEVVWRSE